MPRRSVYISIAFCMLACGLMFSATLDHARFKEQTSGIPFATLQDPSFTVSSGRGHLLLAGTTASADHERSLLQIANEQYSGTTMKSDFQPSVITPDDWTTTSNRLLYALAAAESAEAVMQPGSIEIRAVSSDAETLAARLSSLRETTNADTVINSNVIAVDASTSFEQLCTLAFSQLLLAPVSFRQSSHEIRTSSFVTLDRLTDFASDCPHVTIAITGHTDASGDESWNQQLSLARAQAVANYMARGGIDPARMLVRGAGSSVPIADNTTAQGRGLNRRIEFALQ